MPSARRSSRRPPDLEGFALNRQAAAFLAVIALMVAAMVFLSPFLLLAIGALGVLLFVVVWLKAAVRGRALLPSYGAAEGALALSGLLFVLGGATAGGLIVARVGMDESFSLLRAMLPIASSPRAAPPPSTRSVHYGDPDTQERVKQAFTKAGIPFTVETRNGEEWIAWPTEHNAAAEAIQERARNAVPNGRNVFFPNEPERQKAFTNWLTRNGIQYEIVREHGREYVVWEEGVQDPVKRFMTERGAECRKTKP